MSAQREAFEAWAASGQWDVSRFIFADDHYEKTETYFAWQAWQAAQAAMLVNPDSARDLGLLIYRPDEQAAQAAMPSRAAALEEAALLVESRRDLPAEAAVDARVKAAVEDGDEDAELRARRHWLDVSTHNAVLMRAAADIRALAATASTGGAA